jgi:hypothetical protein
MDYRDTEAFARSMEAAALRSRYLRSQAPAEFWSGVGRLARALRDRIARALHRDTIQPGH